MSATDRSKLRGFTFTRSTKRRMVLTAIATPAFVATWSGWVGLGAMAGFGPVDLLPGITKFEVNTAITLPVGIEAYAIYALGAWLSEEEMSKRTRKFAMFSGIASLALGALGQIAYHLLKVGEAEHAPWQVVMIVACLPIAVLGMAAALRHMQRADEERARAEAEALEKLEAKAAARQAELEAKRAARQAELAASSVIREEQFTAPAPAPAPREAEQDWAVKLLAEVTQWDVVDGETAEQSMRRYLEQFPNAKGAELDQVVGAKFGTSSGYGRKVAAKWRAEKAETETEGSDLT